MEKEASDLTISPKDDFWQRYKTPIILSGAGIFLLLVGLRIYFSRTQAQVEFIEQAASSTASAKIKADFKVEASGAVVKPGVYTVKPDSRVQDLLVLAGGLSVLADRDWVAKNINLAAKLTDGGKIYIPTQGEVKTNVFSQTVSAGSSTKTVNINTATQTEIEALPGVGPVTAQKIISSRPYGAIEEVLSKKAVNKGIFDKIKDQVSVN